MAVSPSLPAKARLAAMSRYLLVQVLLPAALFRSQAVLVLLRAVGASLSHLRMPPLTVVMCP